MDPAKPLRIALVAEGPSDHAVLAHLLGAYFQDQDIHPRPLQPPSNVPGGWTEVLRYIGSAEFVAAFEYNDYVVVQIDTDDSEKAGYDISKRDPDGRALTPDELAERVQALLSARIGPAVYEAYAERILFAVSVESIECWLLPLFYDDHRRERTGNCLDALNRVLSARHNFSIDKQKKQFRYYEQLLKLAKCRKHSVLAGIADKNPSLTRFIAQLDARFPAHAMLDPP